MDKSGWEFYNSPHPNNQTDSLASVTGPLFFEEMQTPDKQPRPFRPPPKPPIFGIRVHPVVGVIVFILLVGAGVLIALATNPNWLPAYNPFSSITPSLDPAR